MIALFSLLSFLLLWAGRCIANFVRQSLIVESRFCARFPLPLRLSPKRRSPPLLAIL